MPYPEYQDPAQSPIYVSVPKETREKFLDICYMLNEDQKSAFVILVDEYLDRHDVKPRPHPKSKEKQDRK